MKYGYVRSFATTNISADLEQPNLLLVGNKLYSNRMNFKLSIIIVACTLLVGCNRTTTSYDMVPMAGAKTDMPQEQAMALCQYLQRIRVCVIELEEARKIWGLKAA